MNYYLTGKQARDIDRYTSETIGIPGIVLMERAALELANVVSEYESGKRILAVVGTGNNGGDAVAAARILKTRGFDSCVYEVNPQGNKTDSFLIQERAAKNLGVEFLETLPDSTSAEELAEVFAGYDVIIDGIFGVGLSRDVEGVYETAIGAVNLTKNECDGFGTNRVFSESGSQMPEESIPADFIVPTSKKTRSWVESFETRVRKPVIIGCDIPSGIDSDTGFIKGCAVNSDITVTFGYTKFGMLINDGRACSGKIVCREIGLYTPGTTEEAKKLFEGVTAFEYDTADLARKLPARIPDSNKGTNGKVLVIAGSKDIYGAMYLCTSACYAAGAGLVRVVTHDRNRDLLMDKLPEAMVITYDDQVIEEFFEPADKTGKHTNNRADDFLRKLRDSVAWADVILVGPGIGTDVSAKILFSGVFFEIEEGQHLVLDADALNILSDTKATIPEIFPRPADEEDDYDDKEDSEDDPDDAEQQPTMIDDRETTDTRRPIRDTSAFMDFLQVFNFVNEGSGAVLTPHVGEMVRLMRGLGRETTPAEIKANPAEAAQWVSKRTGAICVLKDARTVVSDPKDNRIIYVNTTGNSGMSKGGSGDVLAGVISGLLARAAKNPIGTSNAAKQLSTNIYETVCAAVSVHGRAGDKARDEVGETAMRAGNIIDSLRSGFDPA